MGREVRMVPPGWEHPKNEKGYYIPLYKGPFSKRVARWDREAELWKQGKRLKFDTDEVIPVEPEYLKYPYEEWDGPRPVKDDYMPEWPEGEATMLVMYEDTTEGTTLSPGFATPEDLARWLADNGASAFGNETATYDQWLAMIRQGSAPSAVMVVRPDGTGEIASGVSDATRRAG